VIGVVIKLLECLQDNCNKKNIGEALFNNEFYNDYGGHGNIYMVYFIPRYTIFTFLSIICGHLDLLMLVFPFHLFLAIKFFISKSFGFVELFPSMGSGFLKSLFVCACEEMLPLLILD
jgi:hypothetical protein